MQKIIHISLMIFGLVLLASKSCGPDAEIDREANLRAEQDTTLMEIKGEFESEYLFEDKLMAYGEKAKQKLLDFADYLCLYSDKSMDSLFKQQLKDMAGRLFINKDAVIQLGVITPDRVGYRESNLSSLLDELEESKYRSVNFRIYDLKTIDPLHFESAERYTGKLSCRFIITGISESDSLLLSETMNRVKMVVSHTSKQFGSDTSLLIWQVFLDGIEVID